ncbi:MAG: TolC family protein, partial [Deltaproteobacteria bacterium]|nr:TolC family protein [Deltaproteobacteria bacterium]
MFPGDYPGYNKSKRRSGFRPSGLIGLICICLALSTGCAVGPDYQKPDMPVPGQWVGPTGGKANPPATPAENSLARWWNVFNDPQLTNLIDRAVQANLNLKQAEARVLQARAARGAAVSDLGPTLDGTGSYKRSQTPGS